METLTTTITRMVRLTSTASGGPRYRLSTPGPEFVSRPDCQDSYGWVPEQLIGKPVVLTLDERHRVFGIDTVADLNETGAI